MDILEKHIKEKNVFIYGKGKIQEDFEYIFEWIEICGYYSKGEAFDKGESFVIVCETIDRFKPIAEKLGLIEKEDYIHIDEILYLLDTEWYEPWEDREIIVWGTGNTALELMDQINAYKVGTKVSFFVSSNAKVGETFLEKPVFLPERVFEKRENEFIVVANGAYAQIKEDLIRLKQEEEKDFTNFLNFVSFLKRSTSKPSLMMKKTMYASQVDVPFCEDPFKLGFISSEMECCCDALVNTSIGGVTDSDLTKIWTSYSAKIFRLSILNKTFCFCIWENCFHFDGIPEKSSGRYIEKKDAREHPEILQINIDETCNLHCPSCRTKVSVATGKRLEKHMNTANCLIESGWLEKCERIILAGYGEVFASKVYEKILYGMNETKRKNISILTNLLLFTPEKWKMIEGKYEEVVFEVSVDAAKKETYEYLRRGGKWETIQKRLQFLSKLRKEGKVKKVSLCMVVQRRNYQEINDFVAMTEKFGFDCAYLQKMYDLGSFESEEEYLYEAMVSRDGRPIDELNDILKSLERNSCVELEQFNM